eukprot:g69490.t1
MWRELMKAVNFVPTCTHKLKRCGEGLAATDLCQQRKRFEQGRQAATCVNNRKHQKKLRLYHLERDEETARKKAGCEKKLASVSN